MEGILAPKEAHHAPNARTAAQAGTEVPLARAAADLVAGSEAGTGQGLVEVVVHLNALHAVILIARLQPAVGTS